MNTRTLIVGPDRVLVPGDGITQAKETPVVSAGPTGIAAMLAGFDVNLHQIVPARKK
jgi:hypothetical protein